MQRAITITPFNERKSAYKVDAARRVNNLVASVRANVLAARNENPSPVFGRRNPIREAVFCRAGRLA